MHLLTLSSVLQLVPYFSWQSAVTVTAALVILDLSGRPCRPCSHQSRPQVLLVVALVVLSSLLVAFPSCALAFWSLWSSLGRGTPGLAEGVPCRSVRARLAS